MLIFYAYDFAVFMASPQYAVHAKPVVWEINIEYLTLETPFRNYNIL